MTSEKQIAANRLNAQRSTGPRSLEGKAASRRNAMTHGALAKIVVVDGEDEAGFQLLLQGLFDQFDPQTELEQRLVDKLAIAIWRDRRLAESEKLQIEAVRRLAVRGMVIPVSDGSKRSALMASDLVLLSRYQVSITNEIFRLVKELRAEIALRATTIDVKPESRN
jgi:hypothetical protein